MDVLKYLQQRSLMDPNQLAKNEMDLYKANAARLRKSIFPQVTAQLQETGNINAPYLAAQAYTTAIAPTLEQMQMATLEDEIRAQQVASGMWPDTETALGGFAQTANIFGGSP
jgi:hypothetical protein